jgi:hypothetical protein
MMQNTWMGKTHGLTAHVKANLSLQVTTINTIFACEKIDLLIKKRVSEDMH